MKKLKGLIAAVLVGATILSATGCSGVKYIEDEDVFFDALQDAAGIKKKEMLIREKNTTYNGVDVEYLTFTEDGGNTYCYIRFEDEDDAMDTFKDKYDSFEDLLDDKEFDGSNKRMLSNDKGYLILDGDLEEGAEFDGSTFNTGDVNYYGGFYVNKNVYIEVYTLEGSRRDKEKINAMLKALNFPAP